MFIIEELQQEKPGEEWKRVIDRERDAWLQVVRRHGPSLIVTFKLVWDERTIPFDARHSATAPKGFQGRNKNHLHWEMAPEAGTPFGCSLMAEVSGVAPYEFKNSEEREAAILLATEALLEYGASYDGNRWDATRGVSVQYRDRVWSKEDFKGLRP